MARLLVIRRNRLGDAVSVLPWLQGLKKARPDLCIHVLTNPYAAAVFQRSSVVDEVFVLPEEYCGMPIGVLWHPTLRRVRKQATYDYVVHGSYSFSEKAAILAYLVPGTWKTGMVSGKGKLLDKVWDVPVYPSADVQAMHQVMRIAHVGELAGLAVSNLPEPILQNHIQPKLHQVALCPSVNRPQSSWPDTHWIALERLLLKEGYAAVWIGRKPAGTSGELLETASSDLFFDALASSEVVACCEGGTSHVAAALGCQTVVLSGVAIRKTWCPWARHAVVLERTGAVDAISEHAVMQQIRHLEAKHQFMVTEHAYLNPWLSEHVDKQADSKMVVP